MRITASSTAWDLQKDVIQSILLPFIIFGGPDRPVPQDLKLFEQNLKEEGSVVCKEAFHAGSAWIVPRPTSASPNSNCFILYDQKLRQ